MNIPELFDCIGVPLMFGKTRPTRGGGGENPWRVLSYPPEPSASALTEEGVWCRNRENANLVSAFHEGIHALVGPASFSDELESGCMAVEWAFGQELDGAAKALWRETFSEYGLYDTDTGIDEVGMTQRFLKAPSWKRAFQVAVDQGFLMPDGRPVWGLGMHPRFDGMANRLEARSPESFFL